MSSAELLGREAELVAVERLLVPAHDGPGVLMLEGSVGIGKTTLWLRGLELGRECGYRVLSCRPSPTEIPLAFSALDDVLAELTGEFLRRLPPPQRNALEVGLLLRDAKGAAPDQRAISIATLTLLRAAAEEAPLLVGIDDVQWLDASSARVLAFVFRRIEHERCRVLLARRVEQGEASPGFPFDLEYAPRLLETLERCTVGPLSFGAIQSLIRRRLSARLPRRTLAAICAASGGNPFYALELARARIERRALVPPLPDEPVIVPESLRALVSERLGTLPDDTRETLLVASALAEPTVTLVRKAGGGSLSTATRSGVIELEGERIRFIPSLAASVLYAQAPAERRRGLHALLATIAPRAEERARHLALATAAPDAEVAATLASAAEQAASRGAPDAAAELYEHSYRLTPPDDPDSRRFRRIEAISHHYRAGDLERARTIAEEMLADADKGPWRTDVLVLLADMVEDEREAIELCRQAVEAAGEDKRRLTLAYLSLARTSAILGDFAGQVDAQHRALEHAEDSGDSRLLVEALQGVGNVTVLSGGAIDEEIMQRAMRIDSEGVGLPAFHGPAFWYGMQLNWTDELDRARPLLNAQLERAREEGDLIDQLQILAPLIELEVQAGNWDLAELMADEAWEQALDTGHEYVTRAIDFQRLQLAVMRGQVERSRRWLAESRAQAERANDRWRTLVSMSLSGLLELSLGNASEAWRCLEPAVRLQDELGADISIALPLYSIRPNAIEALTALGKLDEAERLLVQLEENVARTKRPNGIVVAARSRALVAAGRGDLAAAHAALERALAGLEKLPYRLELGRTMLVLGTIERRAKRKRDAREAFEKARENFSILGASLWAEKAEAELERVAGRMDTGSGLTATELQVAELVAAGRSNKEVAAALFMSVRTVEANLSKIYRKLGIDSRTELANRFHSETDIAPKSS